MKKIIILLSTFMIAYPANSQDTDNEKNYLNEIRGGFFQFFFNTFYLEYEHCFRNNTGLVLQGAVTLKKDSYEEIFGGQGGLQYRVYTSRIGHDFLILRFENAYLGPYFKYRFLDVTDLDGAYVDDIWQDGEIKNAYNTFSGGILVGFKLSLLERIAFDFNIGGGVQFTDEKNANVPDYTLDMFGVAYTGVIPTANCTFGIRF